MSNRILGSYDPQKCNYLYIKPIESKGELMVQLYDCPECYSWASVFWFVVAPNIWKCKICQFTFEPKELIHYLHCPDF